MKLTFQINTESAVAMVKQGADDAEIMAAFGLSAVGLAKLFAKLVRSGALTEAEVHARYNRKLRTHVVKLARKTSPRLLKTKIDSMEAVKDIRGGLTDLELMRKYNISSTGLLSLFRKLAAKGKISKEELDRRRTSFEWAQKAFIKPQTTDTPAEEDGEDAVRFMRPGAIVDFFIENSDVVRIFVAVAAVVVMAIGIYMHSDTLRGYFGFGPPVVFNENDQFSRIFEAIEKGGPQGKAGSAQGTDLYRECLKQCERDHMNDEDNSLRANCGRECLATYSERFKRIRQIYYSQ